MQKALETDQFHRLGHTRIANQQKIPLGIGAVFGQLHESSKPRGIKEINFAEIDHCRQSNRFQYVLDVLHELFFGVGIQLSSEMKHKAAFFLLKAASEGDGQSLQFADGTNPSKSFTRQL